MNIEDALEQLKKENITSSIQMLRRWIRQGKIEASLPSKKEGYQVNAQSLADFIEKKKNEVTNNIEVLFLNKQHMINFTNMVKELGFEDIRDPYWNSLVFIIAGNDRLFSIRHSLVNFDQKEINSERWFDGSLSSGEQRLLALAYNLFTNQDFYEFENGRKYNISPLEIFSGVDKESYQLAKNAIDVRLQYY